MTDPNNNVAYEQFSNRNVNDETKRVNILQIENATMMNRASVPAEKECKGFYAKRMGEFTQPFVDWTNGPGHN